jgi:hypothetical protein
MAAQPAHHRRVGQADERLQELQLLRHSDAPAARQPRVIEILPIHAGGLQEHIFRIEKAHEIDQPHLPRPSLFADDRLQSRRGGAMPAARVEVQKIDGLHRVRVIHDGVEPLEHQAA